MARKIRKTISGLLAFGTLFSVSMAQAQTVTDNWAFNNTFDNSIMGGKALIPITSLSNTVTGPSGAITTFNVADGGTLTWETAIIGGQTVPVSHFTQNAYFVAPHGAAANGGGSYVNQYSIVLDVLFPADFSTTGSGWIALLNTNANNNNDADWYINPDAGMGISGQYLMDGNPLLYTGGTWHRLALVLDDTSASGPDAIYRSYIDGQLQNVVQSPGTWPDLDGTFSLYTKDDPDTPWFTMFGEGYDTTGYYEALEGWIHNMQVRDYAMSAGEVAQLGAPTAGAIDTTIFDKTSVSGTVQFEGINAAAPSQAVTFEVRPQDGTATYTLTKTLDATGTFTLDGLLKKNYVIHVKSPIYLATNVTVDTTGGDVSGLTISLPTGDANGDNAVDIGDFGLLINAFGGDVTDPTSPYDLHADFNGDGLVDIGDFGLLVNNFGTTGAL